MAQAEMNLGESKAQTNPPARKFSQKTLIWLALAVILIFAAALRLIGVNWDQNQHLHPDERFLTMVETAIQFPSSPLEYFSSDTSPLSPYNKGFGTFVYGTFPIFLTKAIGVFLQPFTAPLALALLPKPAPENFGAASTLYQILTDSTGYDGITLLGRVLSALSDLACIVLIFIIARKLYDWRVGLVAALLLAASVTDIQQSHYFTVDTFTNVPILLAMLGAIWITDGKDWRTFLFAGAFLGLAVAGRINVALFAGIIALASALRLIRYASGYQFAVARTPTADASAYQFAVARTPTPDAPDPPTENATNGGSAPRTIRFGPLSLTAVQKARAQSIVKTDSQSSLFRQVIYTAGGLALAALASLIVFRIAQPYAFNGLLGLNQKFVTDINYVRDLTSGAIDYPPSHNWTDRAPFIFPLYNMIWFGLGIPLGIAGWLGFLVAGWQMLRARKWTHLLLFFWVGGSFLYQAAQFVKTLRYFLPIIPFLILFAAYLLVWLWDKARAWNSRAAKIFAGAVGVGVVGYTLFYAVAFIHIYEIPTPRVTASHWIYANIPCGSTVGNENWDDPIPLRVEGKDGFAGCYKGIQFDNYAEDEDSKRTNLLNWIDQSEYIFLTSDRLSGSIPRLPLRYPLTSKYYGWLFDGQLGFDLVTTFTSYPTLGPVTLNDDASEEIFRNYEHPKVWIFKKGPNYSRANVAQLFATVDLTQVIRQWPIQATEARNGLLLSQNDFVLDSAGGTWMDIFQPGDLLNQFPVAAWIIVLEMLGLVAFPIVFLLFRGFTDRGYALAKTFGILLPAWGAWTLASYHTLPFSRLTILAVLCVVAVISLLIAWWKWDALKEFLRANWRLLLVEEALWYGFFAFFLLIRYGNPDLWHPWFGGEKPMDFAYLNAVTKSTYFPPYDPWFAGGRINYYYFGQLISATLLRLTGIVPEVGYNLLLPMYYAMTTLGTFTVVFNLVAKARKEGERSLDRAVLAGIFGALLVALIGNLGQVQLITSNIAKLGDSGASLGIPGLDSLAQFFSGVSHMLATGKWFDIPIGNYYWNATRTIPDTINEFPFFTFLYADLHAHLMSLAFTLTTMALAVHATFIRAKLNLFDLLFAALTLGALRAINTWDFPTYLAVIGAALVIGYFAREKTERPKFVPENYLVALVVVFFQIALIVVPSAIAGAQYTTDALTYGLVLAFALLIAFVQHRDDFEILATVNALGWRFALLALFAVGLYFPFIYYYGAGYTSVDLWKDPRTTLGDFLTVHGIFLFMVASYLVLQFWNSRARLGSFRLMRFAARKPDRVGHALWLRHVLGNPSGAGLEFSVYGAIILGLLMVMLYLLGFAVVALVLPFLVLAFILLLRIDLSPTARFVTLLIFAGVAMTLMVEFIVLKGDIGRMNTVFKFYLQVWVFFGVASATGLALMWERIRKPTPVRILWWLALGALLFGGFLYPAFATWAKVNDRYPIGDTAKLTPSLDGMDYMKIAIYQDQNKDLHLIYDQDAIQWIRRNIKGSPVIAEANTPLYHWGSRVSIYTGLPDIIGWDWHQRQQRELIPGDVIDRRLQDVKTLFTSADPNDAVTIINRYNVSLVYVGEQERAFYPPEGLSKFDAMTQAGLLHVIFDNGAVRIYQVNRGT